MIELEAKNLEWITGKQDDPDDQCCHGLFSLTVNGTKFVSTNDGEWTLTIAALHLLRTLNDNHLPESRVTHGFLIPCCGMDVYFTKEAEADLERKYPVVSIGCPTGIDVWVKHTGNQVQLRIDKKVGTISYKEWVTAVFRFTDQILEFYAKNSPKSIIEEPKLREGWSELWKEITRRRAII